MIDSLPAERAAPETRSRVLQLALLLFLLSCVFDPADRLLGLKVQLFLFCWLTTVVMCAARHEFSVHVGLLAYTLLFVLIPVLSIAWYGLVGGGDPFEGFQLLKGFLLIWLAALLFVTRIDLLPTLSAILTALAVTIILSFIAVSVWPELFATLYVFGERTGTVLVDYRDYGSGLVLLQVYFVTSPMLAVSIAYYIGAAKSAANGGRRFLFGLLALLNVAAMLLAGTRNNMAVALLLPSVLLFLFAKNKIINALLSAALLAFVALLFFEQITVLLDPGEFSNTIKLLLLRDYGNVFEDGVDLLFGQGLGAYHYWDAKGSYFYTSELTYLELIRNFGAFGAIAMTVLLLFPLLYAFFMNRSFNQKHIVVGYAFYLVMCISNPNLFSSMGILVLSIVLANIFLFDTAYRRITGATPR